MTVAGISTSAACTGCVIVVAIRLVERTVVANPFLTKSQELFVITKSTFLFYLTTFSFLVFSDKIYSLAKD